MNNIELSIVVPCFNEEKNIPVILKNFNNLNTKLKDFELILVDNGSTDATGKIIDIETYKNNYKFVRKVTVRENIGYGFGIASGLKEAKGKILAWTHADLQTDPEDVIRAYNLYLKNQNDNNKILIKGYRKNRKLVETLFSFGMQILASVSLGTYLSEINAQPKLFPRSFYNLMKNPPYDFSFDLYVLYLAKKEGYKLIPVSVSFKDRLYGVPKGGGGSDIKTKWNLIKRTFKYIFELRSSLAKEYHKEQG